MVTVGSSDYQKEQELLASKTLGIPCDEREIDGTLWSGDDKDYKPYPRETHELASPPDTQIETVKEAKRPGQPQPSMMDPFEAAVVAMRNAQVEIQNTVSSSDQPSNQDTEQNTSDKNTQIHH